MHPTQTFHHPKNSPVLQLFIPHPLYPNTSQTLIFLLSIVLSFPRCHVWRRQWQPTPALLPGGSRGQRSLVGCSPWGCKDSDAVERLHFHFSFSCIGEGNGNPLQCSCLQNPRDGGAWWAAIYGAAAELGMTEATQQQQDVM